MHLVGRSPQIAPCHQVTSPQELQLSDYAGFFVVIFIDFSHISTKKQNRQNKHGQHHTMSYKGRVKSNPKKRKTME
jgi:hypothetical protein